MSIDELKLLKYTLKSGEYDGVDLMKAWVAIDELIEIYTTYQNGNHAEDLMELLSGR